MRYGLWYKALSNLERAQIDLTIKLVEVVRSPILNKVLDRIVSKLSSTWTGRFLRMVIYEGLPLTLKLSEIAKSWGHKSAKTWIHNLEFALFLAIMSLNRNRP